jgi:hypothetical protein
MSRLLLVALTIELLGFGLMVLMQATGRVALYQAIVGTTMFLPIPLGILYFRTGGAPTDIAWIVLGTTLIALGFRLVLVHRVVRVPFGDWWRNAVWPALMVAGVANAVGLGFICLLAEGALRASIVTFGSFTGAIITFWLLYADESERTIGNGLWRRLKLIQPNQIP